MKVEIGYCELYPYYGISEGKHSSGVGVTVNITAEEYAEYERISELFEKMQEKLVLWTEREAVEKPEEGEAAS